MAFQFVNNQKIGDDNGVPRTREEMALAMESNYVIPAFRDGVITVDKLLDHADVVLEWYVPSTNAIDFMNFIRLSLGEEPENNNPPAHYFLMDCIFQEDTVRPYFQVRNIDYDALKGRTAILATREWSKSTLIGTYLILYIAANIGLPNFGSVHYMLYVSDSMRNNVKTTMETIGAVYRGSEYLRSLFEEAVTNQDSVKFVRNPRTKNEIALYDKYVNRLGMKKTDVPGRMKRTFAMSGLGSSTGGRGTRNELYRPEGVIFDDLIGNEVDANSEIILNNIESTIESDVIPALSGNKNFALLIGTPYNKRDPVYKRIEDGSWLPVVFPKAEVMDEFVTKKEFRGVWPDRHSYENCRRDYLKAKKAYDNGNPIPLRKLRQEFYLRISSDDDRMVQDNMINWFKREDIIANAWSFNWYISTDLTSTGHAGSNLAAIFLWAVNSESQFFLVDMKLRIMDIEDQHDTIFAMVKMLEGITRGVEVGIEIDGNQSTNISLLMEKMPKKNIFFQFARQRGSKIGSRPGIRSKLEGGNKHWRFRMMLPFFQNRKIWFPVELKGTKDMNELLEELRLTTYSSFGAKYDDGVDAISQLAMMDISYPPPGEMADNPIRRKNPEADALNQKIWGKKFSSDWSESGSEYDSYI